MVHWLFTGRGGRFPFASTNPGGQMELYDRSTVAAHLQCDPGWIHSKEGLWDNIRRRQNRRLHCLAFNSVVLIILSSKLHIIRELKELAKKVFLS